MYAVTILFAVFLVPTMGASPEDLLALCSKLDGKGKACCKTDSIVAASAKYAPIALAEKECQGMSECDRATCISKKIGIVTADGKLIKEKATEILEKDFSSDTDIVTAVKSRCINGDVSAYGLPGQCELVKYQNCVKTHVMGRCTKWDTEGDCAKVKQIAEDCLKMHA